MKVVAHSTVVIDSDRGSHVIYERGQTIADEEHQQIALAERKAVLVLDRGDDPYALDASR